MFTTDLTLIIKCYFLRDENHQIIENHFIGATTNHESSKRQNLEMHMKKRKIFFQIVMKMNLMKIKNTHKLCTVLNCYCRFSQ